ncbi:DUF3443 domain-containing protein [Caballeronia sp. LZ065]|uniref:DUF3443 domain-containing protein n=1 Tax=Caballeronia sp. LZ065 TaxID=3038571 RepID=UPI0028637B8C|nr:DUF3443 domain-containing protein [Caballeronia sp. LZ065]MDR5779177.1 DUF3443 domain-containing protein [Caballeronia sp. LZ065]
MSCHKALLEPCALLLVTALCSLLVACGGGGGNGEASGTSARGTTTATPASSASPAAPAQADAPQSASTTVVQSSSSNVQPITVSRTATDTRNMLQTSVTLCVPGTNTCQTIDGIQVDTGSHGLRVLASALDPTMALPPVAGSAPGSAMAECAVFGSGYTWGAVRQADIRLAGQLAASTSVQIIADPAVPGVAQDCNQSGLSMLNATTLRGNGILGIGPFVADCGANCANSPMPRWYYRCAAGACAPSPLAVAQQVTNPVANFATDNNGVVIELPDVPDHGAFSVNGTLTFGIGSQANNALGSATVLAADSASAYVTTDFGGTSYGASFIDSGSNGLFFPSTTLARCGGWFCPATTQSLSATIRSPAGAQSTVNFSVAPSTSLFGSGNYAFDNLAGPSSNLFDWGLPFFFGRRVFTAFQERATPAGAGPYYAF